MKLHTTIVGIALSAAWILVPGSARAGHDDLILKHGTYVLDGSPCKEPPFAAIKSWDGIGFSGPHASKCTTHVLSHHSNQFNVSTACKAIGDGTPNPADQVDVETLSLIRLSNTHFVISSETKPKSTYRWCAAE